ncbi:MAG: cupredoxin domain-containing protein [Solirubrobacterales bacterium]|nr:cupredoxin domain-containing protein [Solirubrobacterales bacterium]
MRHVILATVAAAALLAGCGDDDTGKATTAAAPATKASDSIRIKNFIYEPDPVTVKAGTKVTIENADSAPHTVTEQGGSRSFDSGTIKGSESGSVTFSKAGTFKYFCEFHPTMKGTVTVTV